MTPEKLSLVSEAELNARVALRPARPLWPRLVALLLAVTGLGVAVFRGSTAYWAFATSPEKTTWLARRDSTSPAASQTTAAVLECFQVAQPVLAPSGPVTSRTSAADVGGNCTVVLMDHVFGYSYGVPFVGNYVPPDCSFNRVMMNFTVVSEGRQFDRLAEMYFNDTEVWRTSTAEPVSPPGIRWVYLKDMTEYLSLWKAPQKLIFDLGNLITDKYTGSFNTTLTATFFTVDEKDDDTASWSPSDLIIPISAGRGADNSGSHFSLPQDNASSTITDFPRNARRAVFSVLANGQSNEEFWWSNVLQSDVNAFADSAGQFPGYSPFREVQIYVDGQLAGVHWPFPIVFTGGVVPSLHRPIVGLDDFDLREHEIDLTAWLPLLCNGQPHTFEIRVAGLDDSGSGSGDSATLTETVGSSWYVSGKVFVWLDDDADAVTTGGGGSEAAPRIFDPTPAIYVSHHLGTNASSGANETLQYSVAVARTFTVQATVRSRAFSGTVSWSQTLAYENQGLVTAAGYDQVNQFLTSGLDTAVVGKAYTYRSQYRYPLFCNTTTAVSSQGNLSIWADLDQGLELQVSGPAVFPSGLEAFELEPSLASASASVLRSRVNGTASYYQTGDGKNSSGSGATTQVFSFEAGGAHGYTPLYSRSVSAVNGTVTYDHEDIAAGGSGSSGSSRTTAITQDADGAGSNSRTFYFAQAPNSGTGPRKFMGRGGPNPAVAVIEASTK